MIHSIMIHLRRARMLSDYGVNWPTNLDTILAHSNRHQQIHQGKPPVLSSTQHCQTIRIPGHLCNLQLFQCLHDRQFCKHQHIALCMLMLSII